MGRFSVLLLNHHRLITTDPTDSGTDHCCATVHDPRSAATMGRVNPRTPEPTVSSSATDPDLTASRQSPSPERPVRRRRLLRRVVIAVVIVAVLAGTAFYGLGYQLFYRDHSDPLRKVDAIVVLGGEHDGREDYGLQLAREGYASTVLISDPYMNNHYHRTGAQLMQRVCSSSTATIEVICFDPDPSTTRGEAMETQRLARQRHWHSVIVVSWRFHMVRARYIFGQCFDGDVVMRPVPRSYPSSLRYWSFQFAYQFGGLAKAAVLGCDK